jgi:hypothetical protein
VLGAAVAEILTAPTLMRQRMSFLNQNGTKLNNQKVSDWYDLLNNSFKYRSYPCQLTLLSSNVVVKLNVTTGEIGCPRFCLQVIVLVGVVVGVLRGVPEEVQYLILWGGQPNIVPIMLGRHFAFKQANDRLESVLFIKKSSKRKSEGIDGSGR